MPVTEDLEIRVITPKPLTRVFINDVALYICHATNCPAEDGMCGHQKLATELVRATLDHYADTLDRVGHTDAAALLRGEM